MVEHNIVEIMRNSKYYECKVSLFSFWFAIWISNDAQP